MDVTETNPLMTLLVNLTQFHTQSCLMCFLLEDSSLLHSGKDCDFELKREGKTGVVQVYWSPTRASEMITIKSTQPKAEVVKPTSSTQALAPLHQLVLSPLSLSSSLRLIDNYSHL